MICSAKGCRAQAEWELRWNNPRLHTPDRRKVWLACGEHRERLERFLSARDFLREVVSIAVDGIAVDGAAPTPDSDQ